MEPLLEISNLSINFQVRKSEFSAVKNLNLSIKQNQIVGLVGESGSGKSVTAMSIIRLLPEPKAKYSPESSILFDGEEILKASPNTLRQIRGNKISMIFQEPMTSLNPFHRVGDQIVEAIQLHKSQSKNEAQQEAKNLMNLVEINEIERRYTAYPHELSGGQRQRVAIARALVNTPSIILADEPTGNLDSKSGIEIMKILDELHSKGNTIILVTHEEEIANHANRIITIFDGRVKEDLDLTNNRTDIA